MPLQIGQLVFSKAGRDKGLPFVVFAAEADAYVYVCDGDLRKLSSPKKKKTKHLQPVNHIFTDLAEKISKKSYINDAEVRKEIKRYLNA